MKNLILIAAAAGLVAANSAVAQAPAHPGAAPHAAAMSHGPPPAADRSAISKSCSTQADAKNLHGKPREKFRRDCMKGKS